MDLFSFSDIFALWREVAHIGALTGLSVGALIGCAAALYFGWQIALVRYLVVAVIIAVVSGYVSGVREYERGRADMKAERDADEAKVERAAKARDVTQGTLAGRDANDQIALLAKDNAKDKETIDALRAADQACHPITADQLR